MSSRRCLPSVNCERLAPTKPNMNREWLVRLLRDMEAV